MIDVITGVTTALNIAKKLREVNEKTKDAEIANLIADLMMQLAEIKSQSADLKIENSDLKEKIRQLENVESEKMILKDDAYYTEDGDGPFCTKCYEADSKKIRLKKSFTSLTGLQCPTCLTDH